MMDGASDRVAGKSGPAQKANQPGQGGTSVHGSSTSVAGAMLSRTLLHVCEQLTMTLGVWECSVYEYVPARDCLLTQATWSRSLSEEDIAFVGADSDINHHPGVQRVFEAAR